MGSSTYKVPGGKLLKIRLKSDNGKIQEITIMGDFFLHPEDVLAELEEQLTGVKLDADTIAYAIDRFLKKKEAKIIGANPSDIAAAIILAV